MQNQALILIIDDDPLIRMLVGEALRAGGFQILQASSGAEGLAMFKEHPVDAVLLDVVMPGMDGFKVCAEIRALPEGEHMPVLMLTGLDDLDSITRAFDTGATDFITKPINLPLLGHRVRYSIRATDTTKRFAESERRLHRMAYYDSLTGLPNRQSFHEHLLRAVNQADQRGDMLAVMFLDLDGFKRINDTLGHHLGDRMLRAAAERLRHCVGAGDTGIQPGQAWEGNILSRFGGDEFTLLATPITTAEDAAVIAGRIRSVLEESLRLDDHELFVTASIGIALYPEHGKAAEELLRNADLAMYFAKREGGNLHYYFNAGMNQAELERLIMENQLRRAIERRELSLCYQPQFNVQDNSVCGMEALVRWQSEELGDIPPTVFISLAEESGLILTIGEWVLRTACQQAKAWWDEGLPLCRIAVNVSAIQFQHKGFIHLVTRILKETGLPPELLELELTESALMKDADTTAHTLQALKRLGVQLAIDDFGTGYSSLSRLKQFPIDRLKIDRSFIHDLENDANDAAIAIAVIAMAGSMDLRVVAEGVETAGQLAFLKSRHCDEVQGYMLSRPMDPREIRAFFKTPN